MTHRTDRVFLPSNVERCEPQHECQRKVTCARYLASLPAFGAKMIGADLPPRWYYGGYCPSYRAVQRAGDPAAKPAAKPAVKGMA
jgi:hypothetical protein